MAWTVEGIVEECNVDELIAERDVLQGHLSEARRRIAEIQRQNAYLTRETASLWDEIIAWRGMWDEIVAATKLDIERGEGTTDLHKSIVGWDGRMEGYTAINIL